MSKLRAVNERVAQLEREVRNMAAMNLALTAALSDGGWDRETFLASFKELMSLCQAGRDGFLDNFEHPDPLGRDPIKAAMHTYFAVKQAANSLRKERNSVHEGSTASADAASCAAPARPAAT